MSFNPYLFFSGNCAEAFQRYQEIFGGELQVMTYADLPEGAEPMPGTEPHQVMHAALQTGPSLLMGSDDPTGDGGPKTGVGVHYSTSDIAETKRIFAALSDGGDVQMKVEPTFWSPGFGSCVDRFGVSWMIDTENRQQS
jgi:PhnB protein